MKLSNTAKLIISVSLTMLFGPPFLTNNVNSLQDYFQSLLKPNFAPEVWVFPLAWTFTYAALGVALSQIWEMDKSTKRDVALLIFAIQFSLHIAHSIAIYHFHALQLTVVLQTIQLVFLIIMIQKFAKLDRLAAWLTLPILIWRVYMIAFLTGVIKMPKA